MRPPKGAMRAVKIASRGNSVKSFRTGQTTRVRRADPYGPNWREISEKAKKRDGYKCRKCDSTDRLEVHHIIRVSRGGRTILANLITLCHACHKKQPGHGHMH